MRPVTEIKQDLERLKNRMKFCEMSNDGYYLPPLKQ